MTDYKFVDLIFDPELNSPARFKVAQSSLARNPQQLFALLVERERSKAFFSGLRSHGTQLSLLLGKYPKYSPSPAEDPLHSRKANMLGETLRAFLFSLLANTFTGIASQEPVAEIVMSIIKLSNPAGLDLLWERLEEAPGVLRRLITGGYMSCDPTLAGKIASNPKLFQAWAKTVIDLVKGCTAYAHHGASTGTVKPQEVEKIIYSFPCRYCPTALADGDPADEPPRARDGTLQRFDLKIRTFDILLGSHLGPWKIILSAQALQDLKDSVSGGDFQLIREKFFELASGEWAPKSLVETASNDGKYQVTVFKAFYKTDAVILWQVDVAFDERFYNHFQVIKVWKIGTHHEVAKTRNYIMLTQQNYTKTRISACKKRYMDASMAIPMYVDLAEKSQDQEEQQSTVDIDRKILEGSPMLAKFYSLTDIVLGAVSSGARKALFPVDVAAEEVHVIDHFKTPAFILGRSGTGKTTCLVYKLASRYLTSISAGDNPVRQLLLTRSKNLAQKLKLYTKRLINTKIGRENTDQENEDNMENWDDSKEHTNQSLLSLGEQDFPLVCTFNYFLILLENAIRTNAVPESQYGRVSRQTAQLVEFFTFKIEYWKRFPPGLTKRIPKDLAFVEIMGVIKGSASIASNLEPLSREEYLCKRWRLAPNFATSEERDAVYSLYELYEKIKKERGEIDNIDRVIDIMKALKKNPELRQRVEGLLDEVYVDEVQDQRSLEIELLLTLIKNPCGIHFAGDTAQSISKDSLFRFANCGALFYTRFLGSVSGNKDLLKPTLLPLSHNFRSHKGILNLASLVMELLYKGFPDLVDNLPPEVGELPGPKPILYVGSNLMALLWESDSKEKHVVEAKEFGELRVILVREEKTRRELQQRIGKSALVLTILQSKGMEFEDVFLYDFFTTSPYGSDFAILEDLLREGNTMGEEENEHEPSQHADRERNEMICPVFGVKGITRVKNRLWILESNQDAVASLINLFTITAPRLLPEQYPEPLVEVVLEHESEIDDLRRRFHSTNQTSLAHLKELAYDFMTNRDFEQAIFCFQKANDTDGETLASAYLAEQQGMEHRASGSQRSFVLAFERACKLFLKAGRIAKAAGCQEAMGNFVAAAEIWSGGGRHEEAAWLFIKAGKHKKAAAEYHELVPVQRRINWFINNSDSVLKYRTQISLTCRKQYARLCYLLLIEERITTKLRTITLASLGSGADQESTFRGFGMMNEVFQLYKQQKKYKEAYTVGVGIGFLKDAFQLLVDNRLLQWVPGPQLAEIFDYLQAENLLTQTSHAGKNNRLNHGGHIAAGLRNKQLSSADRLWKTLIDFLNGYLRFGTWPNRKKFQDEKMRGLLDLLLVMKIPKTKVWTVDLTKATMGLECISGAIDILNTVIQDKALPPVARFFLGVIEVEPQRYITLQWSSPGQVQEPRFPIPVLDSKTVRDMACKSVFCMISQSLVFVGRNSQIRWTNQTRYQFECSTTQEYCGSNVAHQNRITGGKLVTSQFLANLKALVSLNQVFSNLEAAVLDSQIPGVNFGNIMFSWRFWQEALLHQMTFVSSYEQDSAILALVKDNLKTPMFLGLYRRLQEFHLYEIEFRFRVMNSELFLSSLLQQMEAAIFLDVGEEFGEAIESILERRQEENKKDFWEFELAVDVVTVTQKLREQKNQGDFPGQFCENIHTLFTTLKAIRDNTKQLSFYFPSVLSLYEELIVLLIFLTRNNGFLIPRSWVVRHLPKWAGVPRTTSRREIILYQKLLVRIVVSFCSLLGHIEDCRRKEASRTTKYRYSNPRRTETLVHRSLTLLAICMVNVGTMKPVPLGYADMWDKAQKVFSNSSLRATNMKDVPAQDLVEKLAQAFTFYSGKDSLVVLVDSGEGKTLPTEFSGSPLAKYGITATWQKGIPKPQTRHLTLSSPNQNSREMNAAYLIKLFWQDNGPRFLQKMHMKRERFRLAQLQEAAITRRKFHCMLVDMHEDC